MKCPMCNIDKPMGSTFVRIDDHTTSPSWICTSCGCNLIKDKEK